MAKALLKTRPTAVSVDAFIDAQPDPEVRKDLRTIIKWMSGATKEKPEMWGSSIVGFGRIHLKYASGRELDWMLCGFSPRKANISIYLMDGYEKRAELLSKLGKYKIGKSCLYVKRLADVDRKVLKELIDASVATVLELKKRRTS